MKQDRTVLILSVTSDIGMELAKFYLQNGFKVIGTYRSSFPRQEISSHANFHLLRCDITDKLSVNSFLKHYKKLNLKWETFISCIGDPRPLSGFFQSNFQNWMTAVNLNSLFQLRILHLLFPLRNQQQLSNVVFFSAGGVNKTVTNFSAYTISKIILIKMCEYINAENPDLNIFTVGPGWTKTKIHQLILNNADAFSEKHRQTMDFLKNKKGTDIKYIYDCIRWLCKKGSKIAGGRNFSIVHDQLQDQYREKLAHQLKSDTDMYKLRRYKNDFQI